MQTTEEKTFPTYGALSRSAMFMGIPLAPMAILIGCTMVVTMLTLTFIGGKALLLMIIPIPILFVFKTVSRTDDRALNILGYELLCFFIDAMPGFLTKPQLFWAPNTDRN